MNLSYTAGVVSVLSSFALSGQLVAAEDAKPKAKSERSKKVDALVKKVFAAYGGLEKLRKHTTW